MNDDKRDEELKETEQFTEPQAECEPEREPGFRGLIKEHKLTAFATGFTLLSFVFCIIRWLRGTVHPLEAVFFLGIPYYGGMAVGSVSCGFAMVDFIRELTALRREKRRDKPLVALYASAPIASALLILLSREQRLIIPAILISFLLRLASKARITRD